jgi:spore coat polysaccharide biosynthesis protein SpsF (cytidylyltransferase family)
LLVIIQARSSSKRFYKKVLFPIKGKPLIYYVISGVKRSTSITNLVVATSKNKSDNHLVNYLKKIKAKYFRGDLNNVAKRLVYTAEKYKEKYFLRINGDSPLIDYKIINKAVGIFKKSKNKYNLITNVFPRTFPKGQSVEIINTKILKANLCKMDKADLEHVTTYFYKNSSNFSIKNFKSYKKKKIKLAVDTKKDLANISRYL